MSNLSQHHATYEEKVSAVLSMFKHAAENGVECPSNVTITERLGLSSINAGPRFIAVLEKRGLIKVERYSHSRRVTIIETGQSTARCSGNIHWSSRGIVRGPARTAEQAKRPERLARAEAHMFRGDLPADRYVDRDPCGFCGVRGDIGCVHNRRAA